MIMRIIHLKSDRRQNRRHLSYPKQGCFVINFCIHWGVLFLNMFFRYDQKIIDKPPVNPDPEKAGCR